MHVRLNGTKAPTIDNKVTTLTFWQLIMVIDRNHRGPPHEACNFAARMEIANWIVWLDRRKWFGERFRSASDFFEEMATRFTEESRTVCNSNCTSSIANCSHQTRANHRDAETVRDSNTWIDLCGIYEAHQAIWPSNGREIRIPFVRPDSVEWQMKCRSSFGLKWNCGECSREKLGRKLERTPWKSISRLVER